MAWPCISRVCCLARFWNQFDKSDLSVPLTVQNYSDIGGQEVRSVAKQPPGVPFNSITQYKQDFKPWPIPRKENFPWMSNGGSRADSVSDGPVSSHHGRAHIQEFACTETLIYLSSSRQEYRPWTGAKPAKSARRYPPAQYSSPGTEATHVPRETSYQAAYSGDVHRPTGLHQGEHIVPSAASNAHPAAVPQQAAGSPSTCSLQQTVPPERTEFSGTTKAEVSKDSSVVLKRMLSRSVQPQSSASNLAGVSGDMYSP
uniref:MAP6 domain containing 1 n=1 Tax=Scophthalmus maximus TaxID=52904 RepID=A0A8D3E8Q2_SCOMX